MSITKKLIIIFIIIVIFILSISIYLSESFRIMRERTIAQNITVMADEILKRIDYNFQLLVEDLFLFSTHDYLSSFFKKEKMKYNETNLSDALYVSEKMKKRFFKYWSTNRGYRLFNNVHIIDLDGNIISSTDNTLIGNKTDINKLLNELGKINYHISDVFYDKKSNDYILSISVMIKKENGENEGIIRADISILSFIKEVEIDFNFQLFELSQLIIVCNKHKKLIYKSGTYSILEDVSKKQYFNNLKNNTVYFKIKENNQKFIYSYAKKSDSEKWIPDWSVIIKNSEKEILSPLKNIVISVYFVIIFLVIILFIVMIFIIRNILSSVKNLQQGAKIIGSGNLDYKIKSISRDELDDVVKSFNEMTGNIVKVTTKKDDLEKEIGRREKAENDLKQTVLNLDRSNKELEQFAYIASHDLQEPLRMVASYTQLLAKRYKDKLDKDANDFINFAVEGAVRMQSLINSLLEYSRVTTRGAAFEKIDCNKLVNEVLKLMENTIKENNAEITITDLPVIYGDEMQIFRVFQNLIQNAIKFKNNDDVPKIHISAKKEKDNYIFSIKDNGIGIDKEYFDVIFVIFKRLHSRDKYQGSGMGLSIAKRIIERHGGTIWLESEPGKGTIFYFTIPVMRGEKNEQL